MATDPSTCGEYGQYARDSSWKGACVICNATDHDDRACRLKNRAFVGGPIMSPTAGVPMNMHQPPTVSLEKVFKRQETMTVAAQISALMTPQPTFQQFGQNHPPVTHNMQPPSHVQQQTSPGFLGYGTYGHLPYSAYMQPNVHGAHHNAVQNAQQHGASYGVSQVMPSGPEGRVAAQANKFSATTYGAHGPSSPYQGYPGLHNSQSTPTLRQDMYQQPTQGLGNFPQPPLGYTNGQQQPTIQNIYGASQTTSQWRPPQQPCWNFSLASMPPAQFMQPMQPYASQTSPPSHAFAILSQSQSPAPQSQAQSLVGQQFFATQHTTQMPGQVGGSAASHYHMQHSPLISHDQQRQLHQLPYPQRQRSFSGASYNDASLDQSNRRMGIPPDHQAQTSVGEPEDEPTEDELFDCDLASIFVEHLHKPATAMAYPLPGVHHQEIIPTPAAGTNGLTSRYVFMTKVEAWMRDIRHSLHWQSIQSDPAFQPVDFDAPSVLISEVRTYALNLEARRGSQQTSNMAGDVSSTPVETELRDSLNTGGSDTTRVDRVTDQSTTPSGDPDELQIASVHNSRKSSADINLRAREALRSRSQTPAVGTPYIDPTQHSDDPATAISAKDPWAPSPQETSVFATDMETEAKLASLGVTGAPKPVVSHRLHENGFPRRNSMSQPGTPTEGFGTRSGSVQYGNHILTLQETPISALNRRVSYGQHTIIPPPPPPPGLLFNAPNMGPGYPLSSIPGVSEGRPGSSPVTPTASGEQSQGQSPPTNRVINGNGKRPEPQRQVDDVTPQRKKRQPQVDSAYGRRW